MNSNNKNMIETRHKMGKSKKKRKTHHGILGKGLDLLDGARSTLLEGNTVNLYDEGKEPEISLPSQCQAFYVAKADRVWTSSN
jgi:hypothetical protein